MERGFLYYALSPELINLMGTYFLEDQDPNQCDFCQSQYDQVWGVKTFIGGKFLFQSQEARWNIGKNVDIQSIMSEVKP